MKILKTLIALSAVLSCLVSSSFATNPIQSSDISSKPELHLEYLEFYENQQYYKDLARTNGYRLVINVGDEYADLERARIAQEQENASSLIPVSGARGASVPTKEWDISKKGTYRFEGYANNSPLYTQYYITGWTSYEVSVYNNWDKYVTQGFAYGTTRGANVGVNFSCDTQTTTIEYFTCKSDSHFYLMFQQPADVEGYIAIDY